MDKWIIYTLVVIAGLICIFSEVKINFKEQSANNHIVQNQILENNVAIENNTVIDNNTIIGNNTVMGNNTVEGNVIVGNEDFGDEKKGPWNISDDKETIVNTENGEIRKVGGVVSNDEVLKATAGTESRYKGTWTIIGVEQGKLKLVSTEDVGTKKLGFEDEETKNVFGDVNTDNLTSEERFKRSVWSYQNAIDNLNKIAREKTGIASARSVDIEDLEEVLNITEEKKKESNSGYGTTNQYCFVGDSRSGNIYSKYLFYNAEKWSEWIRSNETVFISNDKKIDGTEENKNNIIEIKTNYYAYNYTEEQKNKFSNSLAEGDYWIASECFDTNTGFAHFMILEYSSRDKQIYAGVVFDSNGYTPLYTESKRC